MTPDQIANAIDDALTEIGLQPTDRPVLKAVQAAQRSEDDVLDDILGVGVTPGVGGETAARQRRSRGNAR